MPRHPLLRRLRRAAPAGAFDLQHAAPAAGIDTAADLGGRAAAEAVPEAPARRNLQEFDGSSEPTLAAALDPATPSA